MLIQQKMSQVPTVTQRIDQRMVMANTILQMSSIELQAKIEQELLENPALELVQLATCLRCQGALIDGICPSCAGKLETDTAFGPSLAWSDVKYGTYLSDMAFTDDERDEDPVLCIQAEADLSEYLFSQLRAVIPSADLKIGEFLIESLNEDGYLECELSEVAQRIQVDESRVQVILSALQSLDPPGVGARNLQECLLIQLRALADEGQEVAIPRRMVEECWHEMILHSYNKIARKLHLRSDDITEALSLIRGRLNPYPGRNFSPSWCERRSEARVIVQPDVIIRENSEGFEVEVVESDRLLLKISDDYRKMLQEYASRNDPASAEIRAHVSQYLSRAQLLIRSISQRRRTIIAITRAIIDCQQKFVASGSPADILPLTRAAIARCVGMHESTISRATAGKFVQLPTGETISFDDFFQGALSIKDRIHRYISEEDPSHPLTDQDIARKLAEEHGILVARRTVLKYREQMKILPSNQRRGI